MNPSHVGPELDADRVQADDDLSQTSADHFLVLLAQLGFGQDLVDLGPSYLNAISSLASSLLCSHI